MRINFYVPGLYANQFFVANKLRNFSRKPMKCCADHGNTHTCTDIKFEEMWVLVNKPSPFVAYFEKSLYILYSNTLEHRVKVQFKAESQQN